VPREPHDVNSTDLHHDPPELLLRARGSALVVLTLIVAAAAIVLGALGFLPGTRMRSREVAEQLE
jgi:hypothetical protein